ncbi:hypothetical protein F511_41570 [Dorcoceras hygrometricum]|uniref:Uncharacterized protein n=1 Tax=Dorcoceras hygrometricum TaxID=472368 RepID=A0A2Z7CSH7_9LAMI|nr:hypothetical protein F511_41570 [Dorcoceras hygrometricum]
MSSLDSSVVRRAAESLYSPRSPGSSGEESGTPTAQNSYRARRLYGVVKKPTPHPSNNKIIMTRCSMDGVLNCHDELMRQLEKLQAQRDEEKKSLLLDLEETRDQVQSSEAWAKSSEARDQRSEEEKKGLQDEVKRLQGEAVEDMPDDGEMVEEDISGPEATSPPPTNPDVCT